MNYSFTFSSNESYSWYYWRFLLCFLVYVFLLSKNLVIKLLLQKVKKEKRRKFWVVPNQWPGTVDDYNKVKWWRQVKIKFNVNFVNSTYVLVITKTRILKPDILTDLVVVPLKSSMMLRRFYGVHYVQNCFPISTLLMPASFKAIASHARNLRNRRRFVSKFQR